MLHQRKQCWEMTSGTGRIWISVLLLCIATAIPNQVFGQAIGLKNGDRIKVTAPTFNEKDIVGHVDSISKSTITIRTNKATMTIPKSSIGKLALSAGKKRNTGKGALLGAVSGGLVLGIVAAASNKSPECNEDTLWDPCDFVPEISDTGAFAVGAIVGTLGGAAVGAIIGAMTQSERWEHVPLAISMGVNTPYNQDLSLNPTLSFRLPIGKRP